MFLTESQINININRRQILTNKVDPRPVRVSARLFALSFVMWDRKWGYGGHLGFISFIKSFLFSVECLETWHIGPYRFLESASLLSLSVFMCDPTRG